MDSFQQNLQRGFLDEAAHQWADTEARFFLHLGDSPADLNPVSVETCIAFLGRLASSAQSVGLGRLATRVRRTRKLYQLLRNREGRSQALSLLLRTRYELSADLDFCRAHSAADFPPSFAEGDFDTFVAQTSVTRDFQFDEEELALALARVTRRMLPPTNAPLPFSFPRSSRRLRE